MITLVGLLLFVVLNVSSHEVFVGGECVSLTLKEFELLFALMSSPNKVLKREDLLSGIWGYNYLGETRTLDMHIKTLRNKLSDALVVIETVRGVGFKLQERQ